MGLSQTGQIAPGMQADLALYDLNHPRYAGHHDLASAPITAGGAPHLKRVWVAGREVVRDGDIAARYGGEEFALVLPNTSPGGARLIAEKLRQTVVGLGIAHTAPAADARLTVSIGLATQTPAE